MAEKLEQAFHKYIDVVQFKLQKRTEEVRKGPLHLLASDTIEVRTLDDEVEELEKETEFLQLVTETRSTFLGVYHGKATWAWQQAVKNFFRRSGCYSDIFEKKILSVDTVFLTYCEAFQRRKIRVTYLAPMEFVHFAEPLMDFGTFQIRQFSAAELRAIFRNRDNEVFYPWATIDVKQLQDYWFVYFTELAPIPKLGYVYLNFDPSQLERVSIEYTRYPKAIETVLQHLALFDWQADWWKEPSAHKEEELKRGWCGFDIPFVLRMDDNLLNSPRPAPDLSKLNKEPYVDALTGEEIGERPIVHIHLNADETSLFKSFTLRIGSILASLKAKQNGWQFLEIASGYFVKAFLTEGLEQLLWHITVLEALVGEKGKGVTERLARLIASISGESKSERKDIRKKFKKLYEFRCDLVHGNPFQNQTYVGHLRDARSLARQTLLWFLHCLNEIRTGFPKGNIPTREEILTLLDLEQNSRVRLARVIKSLPTSFPYVREWME